MKLRRRPVRAIVIRRRITPQIVISDLEILQIERNLQIRQLNERIARSNKYREN